MPINFFKHIYHGNGALITRIDPPESLKDFVEGFYLFKTQDLPGRQLFFNDGYPVITLTQDRESKMTTNSNGELKTIGSAWVCGGLLKNIYRESAIQAEELFVIRFNPITFFRLFGIRENIFESKPVFDLAEIAENDFGNLNDNFYSSTPTLHKIDAVTAFLSQRIFATVTPNPLGDVINKIDEGCGLSVRELAKACGARVSYKWLERNFKKHTGLSPKDHLLRRRFLNTYFSLDSASSKTLLQIALEHGYYDDNHMIKDFRSFSGQPPKAFFETMSKSLPGRQKLDTRF